MAALAIDYMERVLDALDTPPPRELEENEKILIERIVKHPNLGAPVGAMVTRMLQGLQQGFKDLSMTQCSYIMQQARNLSVSLNR